MASFPSLSSFSVTNNGMVTLLQHQQPMIQNPTIAYDCYLPNTSFSAATPGVPHFYVSITCMDDTSLTFQHIQYLLQQSIVDIPINSNTSSNSNVQKKLPENETSKSNENDITCDTNNIQIRTDNIMDPDTTILSSNTDNTTSPTRTTIPLPCTTMKHHIPLKIATVSDTGTVIMFCVSNVGVTISNQKRNKRTKISIT